MKAKQSKPQSTEEYITAFPKATQALLQQVRQTIRKAAPKAEEKISYAMPAFVLHGNLVYFAGYEKHIGFYPGAAAIKAFEKDMAPYKHAKGSVQFPLDKPMPLALIAGIVRFRVRENMEKKAAKKQKRVCPKGHTYYKSSDCPTCPVCEQARKPMEGFLSLLSAPARRALENKGIGTLQQLARFSEAELLGWHGLGPASLPPLRAALKKEKLSFSKK